MAILNQLSAIHVLNGEVSFQNLSGSDIAANLGVMIDLTGANQQTAQQPPSIVLPTVAASTFNLPMGVTMETIKNGGRGRVQMLGGAVCTADGSISSGQWVELSNASGKLGFVRAATGACQGIGYCISQNAVAGDPVLIWLQQGRFTQSGITGSLSSGVVTVSNVVLTASSRIFLSRNTQAGTVTNTVVYEAPAASRNVGAGTFVAQASVAAGTANSSDTSTLDYLIVN